MGDIEDALRAENVELPAGSIESDDRQFIVRLPRNFATADDFQRLAVTQGSNGHLIRLADVARVEVGS
ncbi:efflux RND transporter permease subunit, partial [Pollutimonas sp. H1-120]|uniref:efflux RND transporter permease subunit n=1 Tax=Pollutimonas sp. H1-120 TaxID=3148824 RepID=UPI003B525E21